MKMPTKNDHKKKIKKLTYMLKKKIVKNQLSISTHRQNEYDCAAFVFPRSQGPSQIAKKKNLCTPSPSPSISSLALHTKPVRIFFFFFWWGINRTDCLSKNRVCVVTCGTQVHIQKNCCWFRFRTMIKKRKSLSPRLLDDDGFRIRCHFLYNNNNKNTFYDAQSPTQTPE